jgi:predicted outer membrane repeat protein
MEECQMSISHSTVVGCVTSQNFGGAISFAGLTATLTMEDVCFMHCRSGNSGGGLRTYRFSSVNCVNCSWLNCWTKGQGGAVVQSDGSAMGEGICEYTNCVFVSNCAGEYGGAIHINSMVGLNITSCSFLHNKGNGRGGAVSCSSLRYGLSVTQSVFVRNYLSGCTVVNDTCTNEGGAIFISLSTDLLLNPSVVVGGCVFIRSEDRDETGSL